MDRHQDTRTSEKEMGLEGEERGGARRGEGRGAGRHEAGRGAGGGRTVQEKELPKYCGWSRNSRANPARGGQGPNRRSWIQNHNGIRFTILPVKLVSRSGNEEEAETGVGSLKGMAIRQSEVLRHLGVPGPVYR